MFTQEEKEKYISENPVIEQSRVIWKHEDYFIEKGKEFPVTAIICQHNSKHSTQLCIESLLRFYPDINIVVMDDRSDDDSLLYLKYKALTCPNIMVHHEPSTYYGHGGSLHIAMYDFVKTDYALIMDNDVILERGGCLEEMLQRYSENKKLYAIGTVQICSYENNGEEPRRLDDIVRYINPQFSIVHTPTYFELVEQGTDSFNVHRDAPFLTDGSPTILNSKAARDANLDVEYYPIDKYVSHCGGISWVKPHTIWDFDHDVKIRPFLTIIADNQPINLDQTDTDFDIVLIHSRTELDVCIPDGSGAKKIDNYYYSIRFNIHGEYVVDCTDGDSISLQDDFVTELKKKVIEEKVPDVVEVYGNKCYRRRYFQKVNCLK